MLFNLSSGEQPVLLLLQSLNPSLLEFADAATAHHQEPYFEVVCCRSEFISANFSIAAGNESALLLSSFWHTGDLPSELRARLALLVSCYNQWFTFNLLFHILLQEAPRSGYLIGIARLQVCLSPPPPPAIECAIEQFWLLWILWHWAHRIKTRVLLLYISRMAAVNSFSILNGLQFIILRIIAKVIHLSLRLSDSVPIPHQESAFHKQLFHRPISSSPKQIDEQTSNFFATFSVDSDFITGARVHCNAPNSLCIAIFHADCQLTRFGKHFILRIELWSAPFFLYWWMMEERSQSWLEVLRGDEFRSNDVRCSDCCFIICFCSSFSLVVCISWWCCTILCPLNRLLHLSCIMHILHAIAVWTKIIDFENSSCSVQHRSRFSLTSWSCWQSYPLKYCDNNLHIRGSCKRSDFNVGRSLLFEINRSWTSMAYCCIVLALLQIIYCGFNGGVIIFDSPSKSQLSSNVELNIA